MPRHHDLDYCLPIALSLVLLVTGVQSQAGGPKKIDVVVLSGSENQICPAVQQREMAFNSIRQNVHELLSNNSNGYTCGDHGSGWRQLVFINMTNTEYNCPPGLEITTRTSAKRLCEPINRANGCSSTVFSTGTSSSQSYSEVCGRMVGYQIGSTSAFWGYITSSLGIESSYVEGVSLTHTENGARQHIWTLAAGIDEPPNPAYDPEKCPCDTSNPATVSPPFVGNDYLCESGLNTRWIYGQTYNLLYLDDPLWDGKGCTSTSTCCEFNNPPWFTKQLAQPTTSDIEMRVCFNQWSQETILFEVIELYVK